MKWEVAESVGKQLVMVSSSSLWVSLFSCLFSIGAEVYKNIASKVEIINTLSQRKSWN